VRDSAINPSRTPNPDDTADLNVALTQAYLHGDGAAVERIMALIDASKARESVDN
jgi:hypothetical protein